MGRVVMSLSQGRHSSCWQCKPLPLPPAQRYTPMPWGMQSWWAVRNTAAGSVRFLGGRRGRAGDGTGGGLHCRTLISMSDQRGGPQVCTSKKADTYWRRPIGGPVPLPRGRGPVSPSSKVPTSRCSAPDASVAVWLPLCLQQLGSLGLGCN